MVRPKKIVVIGGVAGGMSAATRLRRLDETAHILVLERSGYVSYANCGLPYHLSETIEKRSLLILQNPITLGARYNLDVRVRHEVLSIDRQSKTVTIYDRVWKVTYVEKYDYLVLSPGAKATMPEGPDAKWILAMRTVEDMDKAIAWLYPNPEHAVILGGGFIGLELAENLIKRGMKVTLIHRGKQLLSYLDPELAIAVAQRVRASGVDLRLESSITSFTRNSVTLADGEVISTDVIFSALGVKPEVHLAEEAGLKIGHNGGIWVDNEQRTSDPNIFAVGDAAEKIDAISGDERLATLAGLANRHGHSVANAIAGARTVPATPTLGTSILSFDGLVAATVGWSEKALRAAGRPVRVIHTHPADHAAYYPGAQTMRFKLMVDPETDLILGAQAVGGHGVDKRIDVISTAIFAGITASDLAQLELAYDPQHGSAKDPINMLGYVNRNIAEGLTKVIEWHELDSALDSGAVLVDVRTEGEYKYGHIEGSLNFPLDVLREHVRELSGQKVVVYCQVGQRGHTAARILGQEGIDVVNLNGGYLTWKAGMASKGDQK
jgi:NADPH-dependent 2,4-dienoyl-CoA reductase/sulfur reductase-like enzyme/rhodanese-related sulfurtransferase